MYGESDPFTKWPVNLDGPKLTLMNRFDIVILGYFTVYSALCECTDRHQAKEGVGTESSNSAWFNSVDLNHGHASAISERPSIACRSTPK